MKKSSYGPSVLYIQPWCPFPTWMYRSVMKHRDLTYSSLCRMYLQKPNTTPPVRRRRQELHPSAVLSTARRAVPCQHGLRHDAILFHGGVKGERELTLQDSSTTGAPPVLGFDHRCRQTWQSSD